MLKHAYNLQFFNILSKVKLNILWNKMTLQCYILIVIALTCLMCLYSCKSQTVFAPSCFPGKHLLSYYHNGANFADVWGGIYMTIYCHSWKAVRLCSTQCPHGILVPSPECFKWFYLYYLLAKLSSICVHIKMNNNHHNEPIQRLLFVWIMIFY